MADLVLVHISDLHFGNRPDAWGNKVLPQSLLGHEHKACTDLEKFYWNVQEREENAHLIMTGDLTRCGHAEEFQLGRDFISSRTDFGNSDAFRIGLNARTWNARSISGNHDQWCGLPLAPLGGPTPDLHATFRSMPYQEKIKLPDGRTLCLIGIDTDADVDPFSCKRVMAQGHFVSQLKALDYCLPKNNGDEVRALMLHHSISCPNNRLLKVVPASLSALQSFIERHHITVLLSGHLHTPEVKISTYGDGPVILEARCGTTTQETRGSQRKKGSPNYSRNPTLKRTNTLLLHRISLDTDGLMWHTSTYVRSTLQGGFVPYHQLRPLPQGNFEEEMKV